MSNDYGEYFQLPGDVQAAKPRKARKKRLPPLTCTDTSGEALAKIDLKTVRAVLDNPVNVTGDGPYNYAMVFCQDLCVSLTRHGRTLPKAVFSICTQHDSQKFEGEEGRDEAIDQFLGMLVARSERIYPPTEETEE